MGDIGDIPTHSADKKLMAIVIILMMIICGGAMFGLRVGDLLVWLAN